jgi:hypothetical protein
MQTGIAGAPPILPFLFITIACGAISGFHCLVATGTSSKQLENERDATFVGYGAMLLEGGLAVLVIIACTAGIGMGVVRDGAMLTGTAAWGAFYGETWDAGMVVRIAAFVEGGANMMASYGCPLQFLHRHRRRHGRFLRRHDARHRHAPPALRHPGTGPVDRRHAHAQQIRRDDARGRRPAARSP